MPTATSTPNTIFRSADAAIIADQLARGSYQRDLVAGNARWSGAGGYPGIGGEIAALTRKIARS